MNQESRSDIPEEFRKLDELERAATKGLWYTVGDPWLPRDCPTYVVAGDADPHVGDQVCFMPDFDANDCEDEAEAEAQGWADAEFICESKAQVRPLLDKLSEYKLEVDRLQTQLAVLQSEMSWYEEEHWTAVEGTPFNAPNWMVNPGEYAGDGAPIVEWGPAEHALKPNKEII